MSGFVPPGRQFFLTVPAVDSFPASFQARRWFSLSCLPAQRLGTLQHCGTSPSQPPDNGLIICSVIGARASQTCGRHARRDQAPPLRDAAASWLGGVLVGERPAIISRVNLDEVEGVTELGSHAEVDFRVHISRKYAQRCPASLLSPSSAHALSPDRTCLRKLFPS